MIVCGEDFCEWCGCCLACTGCTRERCECFEDDDE